MLISGSIFFARISRISPLILTSLFVLTGSVLFLSPVLYAAQVTLSWDPMTDSNVAGYTVGYGTSSRNYQFIHEAGNSTTITASNLQNGTIYYKPNPRFCAKIPVTNNSLFCIFNLPKSEFLSNSSPIASPSVSPS
jgi:hypothetical protein